MLLMKHVIRLRNHCCNASMFFSAWATMHRNKLTSFCLGGSQEGLSRLCVCMCVSIILSMPMAVLISPLVQVLACIYYNTIAV